MGSSNKNYPRYYIIKEQWNKDFFKVASKFLAGKTQLRMTSKESCKLYDTELCREPIFSVKEF